MDPLYLLMIIFMFVIAAAGKNVQNVFHRYSEVPVRTRMTGAQAARYILDQNGLRDVAIERVEGQLTDHYDPRSKVLRLSEPVYDYPSISAVGVAAHEAGHALQDKAGYFALKFRQGFYPLANIGSNLGMILIMVGFLGMSLLGKASLPIALLGLVLYACAVLFTVITLPVEFNASRRALTALSQYGIVTEPEYDSTKKVLNAAALTYVAAAVSAILTLLYYASILLGRRDD